MYKFLLFLILNTFCFSVFSQSEITEHELKDHMLFLTSEKNARRYPGGKENKRVVKYLKKEFKKLGLAAFEKSYKQSFEASLRVKKGEKKPKVTTWNVVGYIEGNDPILKNEFVILGAHYDHFNNFFTSIRDNGKVIQDPKFGLRAAGAALLANESYIKKQPVNWDPTKMKLI